MKVGDQVKIIDPSHPWFDAIGRVRDRFANQDDYWEIELETILPGQVAMAHESEFARV